MPFMALAQRDIIPTYKLNREIHTIPELCQLWTVGIGGALSVGTWTASAALAGARPRLSASITQ